MAMRVSTVAYWIHILATAVVLGGYTFLSVFWWPVLRRIEDVRLQVRLAGQTLRRFFTTVVLALTLQVLTGGLYLLPPAYRAFGEVDAAGLGAFHRVLLLKLAAVFVVLILVPMQLFGMSFRLTRMDAGIYPLDAQVVARIGRRMQIVSCLIIALLTLTVVLSTQL
jgi:uncharacterized membrane protein